MAELKLTYENHPDRPRDQVFHKAPLPGTRGIFRGLGWVTASQAKKWRIFKKIRFVLRKA